MTDVRCPVCRSRLNQSLYPSYTGTCITSDMMVLPDASIDNRFCLDCGLIFNGGGTRGFAEDFYKSSYSLMMRNPQAAIQSFAGPKPISQAERTYQFLREMIELPGHGAVLEAGAGKGEFLTHFTAGLPDWGVHAFEPSESYEVLKESLPNVETRRTEYTAYDVPDAAFDLVVALGVLEHVECPLDMMCWAARILNDAGYFYIRVPNFARNPNDLFCADHLSKLTVPTLQSLAESAGFEVTAVKEAGVPVFMALRKTGEAGPTSNVANENRPVVEQNVAVAKTSMDAILRARHAAKDAGENFGIFGMGPSGLFAPFYADFPLSDIASYVDENKTIWGSEVHGRPVAGLDMIEKYDIRHIALAISPVYFQQVREKLELYSVTVYAAASP